MKSPPTFEIKVALIGNVSAGKTTVLNALFRDKYGEVSMKRTTAGVNEFAVCNRQEWALVTDDDPPNAKSILTEITQDNVELRASDKVQTKRFRIELDEPLCEMRKDTQLVIVDVPGVNEANASKKYWDFVESHWATFDCVVIVMDGRQGVNTECQVSLLQFVKANLKAKKDIPVVILFNKVDDPDDEEQVELVFEAQREVEKLFGVSDRQESLESLLHDLESQKSPNVQIDSVTSDEESNQEPSSICPVFIPVSAIGAFIFQTCSNMTLEKFQEFDAQLIAKLGREYVGKRKWKKLSSEEQIHVAYEAVSDPEGYKDGLEDSNFHKFLNVLKVLIGGETVQKKLLQNQIQSSLNCLCWGPDLVTCLGVIHQKVSASLSTDVEYASALESLKEAFWRLFVDYISTAYDFEELANELIKYNRFVASLGWEAEASLTVERFQKIVLWFLESKKFVTALLVDEIRLVYAKVLEMSADNPVSPSLLEAVKNLYVPLYNNLETNKLKEFRSVQELHHISTLAHRLTEYGKFAIEIGWHDQTSFVCEKFQGLVRKQISILCEAGSGSRFPFAIFKTFSGISRVDWNRIFRSILLLRYSERFCVDFGSEIIWMEYLIDRNVALSRLGDDEGDDLCSIRLKYGAHGMSALDGNGKHKKVLNVPLNISDPKHFGYVAWRYCKFMDEQVEEIAHTPLPTQTESNKPVEKTFNPFLPGNKTWSQPVKEIANPSPAEAASDS